MKYFAYGSNMDQEQMGKRCPSSKLLGKAVLKDHKLAFTIFSPKRQCGCADIVKSEGDEAWGLLYELTKEDLASLDRVEAHPDKYKRFQAIVLDEEGKVCEAETYEVVHKEAEFLPPSKHYLGLLQKAADHFNFPESYKFSLNSILTKVE